MGKIFLTLFSCGVAVAAIAGLITFSGIELDRIGERLLEFSPEAMFLICFASLAQVGLSSIKWRLVLAALKIKPTNMPGHRLSLLLASLSAVVAQFLPVMIAAPALRSVAARYAKGTPFLEGAWASAVEQAFDVLAFSLLLLPTLAVYLLVFAGLGAGFGAWTIVATLVLGAAFLILDRTYVQFVRRFIRILSVRKFSVEAFESISGIDVPLQRRLLAFSLLRYCVILARVLIVAEVLDLKIPIVHLVYAHTVVQAAQLASVTPGNLGLSEWTWLGALGFLGHDVAIVVIFSLTLRVVSVVSYALVSALVAAYVASTSVHDRFNSLD